MVLFSFPCLVVRQIICGHLPPQICIESHSNVNLCHVFYLKAYTRHTEPLRTKPDGLHVTSLFLGNNRQHRPVCAKTISSWVRTVLCVARAHMSLGTLWGAAASAALVAGVSLISVMHAGDRANVSTPARHYFPPTLLLLDWYQDSVQHAVLGLREVGLLLVCVRH